MVVGSVGIGMGVASFIAADIGLPPYDVLLSAVSDATSLSHGQSGWLVAAVFALIAAVLGARPRLSTVAFALLNGVTVDAAIRIVDRPDALATRIVLVGVGTAVLSMGVALVVFSGLTGGVFDLLGRAVEERGIDPRRFRTWLELGVLIAGVLGGGAIGPGTFFFALCIGPAIAMFAQGLEDHRTGRELRLSPAQELGA